MPSDTENTKPAFRQILDSAVDLLHKFADHTLDVIDVAKPNDIEYAIHLSKIISKLSPMLGNIIEYRLVAELNKLGGWPEGKWVRQDPGFPDTIFSGSVLPIPGIEIKTWFPLATEITARFKDSITHFNEDQTNVALIAWLPESLIYGKPKIIDVWIDTAKSVAEARDAHYHNPPYYLVFEPEDTTARTKNLQQTNTNGYVFQGTKAEMAEAELIVAGWGAEGKKFSHAIEYQKELRGLLGKFKYRLDTNFAKMDRIEHPSLEAFKSHILSKQVGGYTIQQWSGILDKVELPKNTAILKKLVLL